MRSTPLTERELQVMRLMFEGFTTLEIASSLGIAYKTAATHRSRIFAKLEVHNTVLAFRRAVRMGLIEP